MIYNTFLGFIVGIFGTSLGGILSIFFVGDSKKFLSLLLSSASGLILAIVTFDLIPQALALSDMKITLLGILIGIVIVCSCEYLFNNFKYRSTNQLLKSGLLMAMAIGIHNIPEGLAIGSGLTFDSNVGIKLAIIISLHNLPEGIAMGLPLRMSGFTSIKVIVYTFLAGATTGIGALIGSLLSNISNLFIGLCFAIAAGAMLQITCGELLPSSRDIHRSILFIVGLCMGFIFGVVIIRIL